MDIRLFYSVRRKVLVDELSIPETLIDVSVLDTRVMTWKAGRGTCILCVWGCSAQGRHGAWSSHGGCRVGFPGGSYVPLRLGACVHVCVWRE